MTQGQAPKQTLVDFDDSAMICVINMGIYERNDWTHGVASASMYILPDGLHISGVTIKQGSPFLDVLLPDAVQFTARAKRLIQQAALSHYYGFLDGYASAERQRKSDEAFKELKDAQ